MSENNKLLLKKILQRALAIFFAVFFFIVCVSAVISIAPKTTESPRTLTTLPNPKATVEAFFDAVKRNDFDAAASYTSNYSSLGISADSYENGDDELSRKLYSYLTSSYDYSLAGDCIVDSKTAVQEVDFTFFELSAITEKLREYAQNIAYDKAYSGEAIDEAAANEILEEALSAIDDVSDYLVTKRFSVPLTYDGEEWHIDLSPELLSSIVGIK